MVNLKADTEVTKFRIEPGAGQEESAEWVYRVPCAGVTYYYFVQSSTKPVSKEVHPVKEAAASVSS